MIPSCTLHVGDNLTVLESLPADHFQCIVTSPPYFALRDYGLPPSAWPEITFVPMIGCPSITVPAESCCLGLEADPMAFVAHMVHVFRLARRVLRPDGVVFMNFGDSMSQSGGHGRQGQTSQRKGRANVEAQEKQDPVKPPPGFKAKDMMGIPWRVAFALQADGWYLRQDIIWSKPNPMPESAKDRCTKAHEYIFLLSKRPRYYWDLEAIKEAASENTNPRRAAIKSPDGWDTGSGSHGGFHKKGREKGKTRKLAEAGGTIKNNTSYESAMAGMVSSRNKRSVWTVGSEPCPEAHFATYPKALVRPMIRAASSAAGCCSACGAPLLRIVETGEPDLARQQACGGDAKGEYHGKATKDYGKAKAQDASAVKTRILAGMKEKITTGWKPSCECPDSAVVPCRVLDIYGGSGTTGEVALEEGRDAILIEMNEKYAGIARQRTSITPGLRLA